MCTTAVAFAGGATHVVTQVNLAFVPEVVTASPGDTIRFEWTGGSHAVQDGDCLSTAGLFYGDLTAANPLFEYMIPVDATPGSIPFNCPVASHCKFGMVGTINIVPSGGGWSEGDVVISEIRIDQPSTDNDEYFELQGEPGLSLDGLTYLVIGDGTGGFGVIECQVPLLGQTIPPDGHFTVSEGTFTMGLANVDLVLAGSNPLNFENGDNVTHMIVSGFTGTNGQLLDTDQDRATCMTEVNPWDTIVSSCFLRINAMPDAASTQDCYYGEVGVGPDATFVPGHVYLCEDGHYEIGGFTLATNDTPGADNPSCVVAVPGDLNGDGLVNGADLAAMLSAWGTAGGDVNGDGATDGADLTIVLGNWTI
ncbi:MAG: hypothetical protein O2819_03445 [Planctomycetota bacterium]|nr:hypothetical protein [Planctomycetota bacterium]MDA1106230.1 hypothetical protein [Planctomycetota bacterium]